MRLDRLRIAGFGRFVDALMSFTPGLNVVFGQNEAGKSTLVECIVRLLFGYPELFFNEARKRFVPWREGAPYRAVLTYTLDDKRSFETERDFGREDVVTWTRDALTKADVAEWSGSRAASPGSKLLGLSLGAYHSAAVVRAPEHELSSRDLDGGPRELADRLGKLVGAAGDSSAKQARERLERLSRDIGGAPNATTTPLTKARAAVIEAERKERDVAGEFTRWHASLEERSRALEALAAARDRLTASRAGLDAAALRSVRQRLHNARDAMARRDAAQDLLARERQNQSPDTGAASARDAEFEDLKIKWMLAQRAVEEAESRTKDAQSERDALAERSARAKRHLDASEATLRDVQAALQSLNPKPAPSTLRNETVERLRRQSDQVDVLERRARTAEAELSVAQLAPRPDLIFFLILAVAAVGIMIASAAVKNNVLLYAGLGCFAAALVVLLSYVSTVRQRQAIIVTHARASDEAGKAHRASLDALNVEVARLGYPTIEALLDAYDMRGKADALEERRRAAQSSVDFARGEEQTLSRRRDDLEKLERAALEAHARIDEALSSLNALLDAAGAPTGPIGERLDAYTTRRRHVDDATRAQGDFKVADAQLAAALGDLTLEQLADEERRLEAAVDAAGIAAAGSAIEVSAELKTAEAEVERCRDAVKALDVLLAEYDRRFPGGLAEYEEHLEAVRAEERRLALSKAAADLARDEIARLAEHVHRNFVPTLNQAASDAVAQVTGGRYTSASVDPKDFAVRTLYPENAATGPLDPLSSGTREVFSLALRIALALALGSGERPPMLLDDPLAHTDAERSRAALAYLQRCGERGLQTIVFTQRESTLAAAREVGANIIELTPVRV